jgi:hypothetical protein
MGRNNVKKNGLLEYVFPIHIIVFHSMLPRFHLRGNDPLTNGKEPRLYAERKLNLCTVHQT